MSGANDEVVKKSRDSIPRKQADVIALLQTDGSIPENLIVGEVEFFFFQLGLDELYFTSASSANIADHIKAMYGAKIVALAKNEPIPDLRYVRKTDTGAVYIQTSQPGVKGSRHEEIIDKEYLDSERPYRCETYRSTGNVMGFQLRCYFIELCEFSEHKGQSGDDIQALGSKHFLQTVTDNTLVLYQKVLTKLHQHDDLPVIEQVKYDTGEHRIIIGFKRTSVQSFFSALSDLYHYYGFTSTRKYVEQFADGSSIYSLFVKRARDHKGKSMQECVDLLVRDVSLLYALPQTPLNGLLASGSLSAQESIYGYSGIVFAQHFLNRAGPDMQALRSVLKADDKIHQQVMHRLRTRLNDSVMPMKHIVELVVQHESLIKLLYQHFSGIHVPRVVGRLESSPNLLGAVDPGPSEKEILARIRKDTSSPDEALVFEAFLTLNKHTSTTNFYKTAKSAISFELDASFITLEDIYPDPLHSLLLVVGSNFRGFHLRFQEVARGGIRIVRSRSPAAYAHNIGSLFDENYGLAHTQQRKNKDIPEGGAKGTILVNVGQDTPALCNSAFRKYISSILDLLISDPFIIDRVGKQRMLFFGPDEGTAHLMDWTAEHARKRGLAYWKAISTGKDVSLGGIPHDLYGMTTRSVHQYVLGILKKLGLQETEVTKFQTGGPDGDLGSNEIKISCDKTTSVVDGSGVLHDPEGINRTELARCAGERVMIDHFDTSLLSDKGFRVLITENNIKLPNGRLVSSGLQFRNTYHSDPLSTADFFVPCGGRPESVNLSNVKTMFTDDGSNRFKAVVEGANLFFAQLARLRMEDAGIIVVKDASANKGGVTSSSLEVLAALTLTDEEFSSQMCVKDGVVPQFRQRYIVEVQERIELNARLEFDCLWREKERSGKALSILSDVVSYAVLRLSKELTENTEMWENKVVRRAVLAEAIPKTLQELAGGIEGIEKRTPEAYLRAVFASSLASRFIYKFGVDPSHLSFYTYVAALGQ